MTKNAKVLLALTSISLLLVIYLILSSERVVILSENQNNNMVFKGTEREELKVNLEELDKDYKQATKVILKDLDNIMNPNKLDISTSSIEQTEEAEGDIIPLFSGELIDKISSLRNLLMGLKVSDNYKDLHIKLVLGFNKLEKSAIEENKAGWVEGQELIKQIKDEYDWLNE